MTLFKKNKSNSAFTLIELLVVISVIGITTTIALSDWSGNRVTQYLNNSAREVEAVIREAQNAALTGVQVTSTDRPCGYQISWVGSIYTVTYRYKDGSGFCSQSSQLSRHVLMNGVVFDSNSNFEFTLPYGAVAADKTIVLTKQGMYHSVCVYTSGRIVTTPGSTCP